jgi:hypothetical protein
VRAGLCAALLLLTVSCKDEGVERHREALEKYTGCVTRGLAPSDPCFDEVLAIVEKIPKSSSARPRADALRESLLSARQPKIRTPLAVQGGANLPPEVITQLQQCQRLAEQLGTTAEADRPAKLQEIEACRAKAEKLDNAHAHAAEDGGAH